LETYIQNVLSFCDKTRDDIEKELEEYERKQQEKDKIRKALEDIFHNTSSMQEGLYDALNNVKAFVAIIQNTSRGINTDEID